MAGPQCCVSGPDAEHCCVGKEETLGPFLSYITSHTKPSAAVILVNDIFGFDAPLLRKLADKIAANGYYVVVPNVLKSDPYVPPKTGDPFSSFGDWIKNHQPVDSIEGLNQVIHCLHEKGLRSIGAAGFCWGAKVVVLLAQGDGLNAAVLAHPSLVTVEDIPGVKTPMAILAAEIDKSTPPELAQKFFEILKAKPEVESFGHIYQGVSHGWTVRYNTDEPGEVAQAEEAHNKMLEWFGKFLQ